MPHIDEKDSKRNPEYVHVKYQNMHTRKIRIKMVENTLFSQIDKVLNTLYTFEVY